jgi:hypothetical protein
VERRWGSFACKDGTMEIVVWTYNSSGFTPSLESSARTSLYFYYICVYK